MKKLLLAILLTAFAAPAWAVDCHISQYVNIAMATDGKELPAGSEPVAAATLKVTFTTTSVQSSTFTAGISFIRVVCTAKAHFEIGTNPTASNVDPFIPANTVEFFGISIANAKIAFQDGT